MKDILVHDIDDDLQFNRVGRELNTTVISNHPGLIGPVNPL